MGFEEQLFDLVRRGVRAELLDSHVLRDELRAALREQGQPRATSALSEEVTTAEAATIAHVRPRTINQWKRDGRLVPVKRGRADIYLLSDVIAVATQRGGGGRKIVDFQTEARRILADRANRELR